MGWNLTGTGGSELREEGSLYYIYLPINGLLFKKDKGSQEEVINLPIALPRFSGKLKKLIRRRRLTLNETGSMNRIVLFIDWKKLSEPYPYPNLFIRVEF